ncbi:hypothetical protein C8Q80DRAFT_1131127 [Daedaleopsis nitida]|nr:hypothetical protein C8Q80DRAFT_1131127 [Daedaleopsis nitida]
MSWLAPVALVFLHTLYRLILGFKAVCSRFQKDPRPLRAQRSNLPSHIALSLVANSTVDEEVNERYMLDSVEKVASWCQVAGIRKLTVYDRAGSLANSSLDLRQQLSPLAVRDDPEVLNERDIQYPPTPPPSDDADSRPLSPHNRPLVPKLGVITIRLPSPTTHAKRRASVNKTMKRRRVARGDEISETSLTIHIVSYKSSKPAIAAAATSVMAQIREMRTGEPTTCTPISLSIRQLNEVLEGEYGFPSPDLMIVHRKPPAGQSRSPVELGGFPPWQMRLTEIYWVPYPKTWWNWTPDTPCIEEVEFRRALDDFASAEMRLGK